MSRDLSCVCVVVDNVDEVNALFSADCDEDAAVKVTDVIED